MNSLPACCILLEATTQITLRSIDTTRFSTIFCKATVTLFAFINNHVTADWAKISYCLQNSINYSQIVDINTFLTFKAEFIIFRKSMYNSAHIIQAAFGEFTVIWLSSIARTRIHYKVSAIRVTRYAASFSIMLKVTRFQFYNLNAAFNFKIYFSTEIVSDLMC